MGDCWWDDRDGAFEVPVNLMRNRTATRYLIYRATSPSGKIYVGLTCNSLKRRIQHHLSEAARGGRFVFHAALRKYGSEIVWDVLEEVRSYQEACEREHHWVMLLEAHVAGKGYNGTLGGDGGQRPTEATRRRMSEAQRGKVLSADHRQKIAGALRGRDVSAATRAKLAACKLGKPHGWGSKIAAALSVRVQRSDGECFASVQEAAASVGRDPSGVSRSIQTGRACGGYQFRLAL